MVSDTASSRQRSQAHLSVGSPSGEPCGEPCGGSHPRAAPIGSVRRRRSPGRVSSTPVTRRIICTRASGLGQSVLGRPGRSGCVFWYITVVSLHHQIKGPVDKPPSFVKKSFVAAPRGGSEVWASSTRTNTVPQPGPCGAGRTRQAPSGQLWVTARVPPPHASSSSSHVSKRNPFKCDVTRHHTLNISRYCRVVVGLKSRAAILCS